MWKFIFTFLFFSSKLEGKINSSALNEDNYCYDHNDKPYIYFSTKTAYRLNRYHNTDYEKPAEGCSAKQFWLLCRHGTRNPGSKAMKILQSDLPKIKEEIVLNSRNGKGSLCEDDILNLSSWEFTANVKDDKYLVKEGRKEMIGLAQRFSTRFQELLTRPFSNMSYKFQFTDSERTDSSAQAYATGMFGSHDLPKVYLQKSPTYDTILRFYKSCEKWKVEVDENPNATIEKTLYENSTEFQSMMSAVSKRLGYSKDLTLEKIDMMYSMCSYEKAWYPRKLSPWCAVFSQEDLEILEYREDLEYYYEDGYGNPINYEQACPTMKDAYDNFRQVVEGKQTTKGIFYFTHSGTLLKVLARFGLFKDEEKPTHTNRKKMVNRKWRTSRIDSFASNFALVLYSCSDGYRVGAFAQEQWIDLPGCERSCHFADFTKLYGSMVDKCDLKEICRL